MVGLFIAPFSFWIFFGLCWLTASSHPHPARRCFWIFGLCWLTASSHPPPARRC